MNSCGVVVSGVPAELGLSAHVRLAVDQAAEYLSGAQRGD